MLKVGYWWPIVFKDCHEYAKKCDICQRVSRRNNRRRPLIPLQVVFAWGIDFMGLINLSSSARNNYNIWVEEKATIVDVEKTIAIFLMNKILCRIGAPRELVAGKGSYFLNYVIEELTKSFK